MVASIAGVNFDVTQIIKLLGISGFIILLFFLSLKMFAKNIFERRVLIFSFILLSFALVGASIYFDHDDTSNHETPGQEMQNVKGKNVNMSGTSGLPQKMNGIEATEDVNMTTINKPKNNQ